MICQFKKAFLRDLVELPAAYRRRIEKLVFEEFPGMSSLSDKLDIRKIQGNKNYYRIRIGDYRIGCEIETGNRITFYRVNPVRNSSGALNPAGIILKSNPAAEQWGIISNGVKNRKDIYRVFP